MKRMFSIVIGIVLILFYSNVLAEEIRAYASVPSLTEKKIVAFIKEKLNIDVIYSHYSSPEVEAKMKAEGPNFSADMLIGGAFPAANFAKKNNWLVPYLSPAWKDISNTFYDSEGYFYNFSIESFLILANKQRLNKFGYTIPNSWKDLIDPKWKNEIVTASPVGSNLAHTTLNMFLTLYGEVDGWKFVEELDKNVAQYTRSANTPTEFIGRGEYTLAITSDALVKQRINDGYPLIWNIPKEGTGYQGLYVMILKGTKKLETCKKIIDLFGTKEFNQMIADTGASTPRPSIHGLYGNIQPKFVKMDLNKMLEDRAKNNEIWKNKFRSDVK